MSSANEMSWTSSSRASARETKHRERVDKLRQDLLNLKSDMQVRRYMLTLVRDRGAYCELDSPANSVGVCGPTRPLLRPGGCSSMVASYASETWRREAVEILRRYKTITDDLQRHGYSVSAFELANWEREAMDMRWRDVDELASKQSVEPRSIKFDFAEIDWDGSATREQWGLHSPSSPLL